MNKYDYLIKIMLIGDSGVGKSSLLLRYDENRFSKKFITTLGIDFRVKFLDINNKRIKLQVWDTAGQERFRTITNAYFRGAMGIIIAYDVTDPISFDNVRNWMNTIKENATEHVNIILVATKTDLDTKRIITVEAGRKLADEFGIKFYETSAVTGTNIEEVFKDIVDQVMNNIQTPPMEANKIPKMNITNQVNEEKGCCLTS